MIPLRDHRAVTISIVGVLLSAASACATIHPHLAPIDDDQIRVEIHDALQQDDRIDAETISVESRDGVVILAGVAASVDEVRRALRHAGRVRGVQQVVNRLRVIPNGAPSRSSDAEIASNPHAPNGLRRNQTHPSSSAPC